MSLVYECLSVSGVSTQGDLCTATVFSSIVYPHLLYPASSPVQRNLILIAAFYFGAYCVSAILKYKIESIVKCYFT
jgi:hypothetical protein